MNAYAIVLFIHFCALIAAFAASALVHFAEARMAAARTVVDARSWSSVTEKIAVTFPLALAVLVGSGVYMVHAAWAWNIGWIDASLAGVFVLALNGPLIVGNRHRRLKQSLAAVGEGPVSAELARQICDPLMRCGSWANTLLGLGIVLVMVAKPPLAASVAILVAALILGIAVALPLRRSRRVAVVPD